LQSPVHHPCFLWTDHCTTKLGVTGLRKFIIPVRLYDLLDQQEQLARQTQVSLQIVSDLRHTRESCSSYRMTTLLIRLHISICLLIHGVAYAGHEHTHTNVLIYIEYPEFECHVNTSPRIQSCRRKCVNPTKMILQWLVSSLDR